MSASTTVTKAAKPHKFGKIILRTFIVILALIAVLIAILAIRNQILTKRDRAFAADAYGEYYTTPQGAKMNYTIIDNGAEEDAVILPGYGSASVRYEFDAFMHDLKDQYNFIVVEPLGYGLSDGASTERSASNFCEELHGLLASINREKYTIIAHSIGGLYSLYYANQYPDEVSAFIGIDATVPHQKDAQLPGIQPENAYKSYKRMRVLLYGTGINRIQTERSSAQAAEILPYLSETDFAKAKALNCSASINDTLLDEMRMYAPNMQECYDMQFPESVPVLYVLAKDNCDLIPDWKKYHSDVVTNPDSKVTIIAGGHFLHYTSRDQLTAAIREWHSSF